MHRRSRFDESIERALTSEGIVDIFKADQVKIAMKDAEAVRKALLPVLAFLKSCSEFAKKRNFVSATKCAAVERAYDILASDKLNELLKSKKLANAVSSIRAPLGVVLKLLKKLHVYKAIAAAARKAASGKFADLWESLKALFTKERSERLGEGAA